MESYWTRAPKTIWKYVLWSAIFFFGGSFFFFAGSCISLVHSRIDEVSLNKDGLMMLDLKGVIFDSKKFVKQLKKFREEDSVKGFVIRVNSPGGVVGPSQELNAEIRRTREEFKKPIVVYSESLNASGAYYASVAADKIFVSPGVLIGSIGVIMEFANLRDLYKWAKVDRYSIKTGEYKDIGADYRPMTDREKVYLQTLINQVLDQFKGAILAGRKIDKAKLNEIADGRIFTGEQAKALKLVDDVGSLQTAIDAAGEMTGLGKNPETFEAPKDKPGVLEFLSGLEGDEEEGRSRLDPASQLATIVQEFVSLKMSGQLLSIYPAAIPGSLFTVGSYK
jgi:protease IV